MWGEADTEYNNDEAAKTLRKNTVIEVAEKNIDESKESPTDTSGFLDEMKAEADTRTDDKIALDPGAADDRPAPRAQYVRRDVELQYAAPGPGEDDQPALQDLQPGIIT